MASWDKDDRLYQAQRAVVQLMPDFTQSQVKDLMDSEYEDDHHVRWYDLIQAILDRAELMVSHLPEQQWWDNSERVPCPICGVIPNGPYPKSGFTVPLGLRRHLEGEGRTNECKPMAVLFQASLEAARQRNREASAQLAAVQRAARKAKKPAAQQETP